MLDKNLLFCEDFDISQAAGTYIATDTFKLDTLAKLKRELQGAPMEIVVQLVEAVTSGGAATVDIQVATGNSSALASAQVQSASGALALAELTLGRKWRFPLSLQQDDADATHIGVQFVIATATTTAGLATAWIQAAGTDEQVF